MEYPGLEGTRNHQVQHLAPHRATQKLVRGRISLAWGRGFLTLHGRGLNWLLSLQKKKKQQTSRKVNPELCHMLLFQVVCHEHSHTKSLTAACAGGAGPTASSSSPWIKSPDYAFMYPAQPEPGFQ